MSAGVIKSHSSSDLQILWIDRCRLIAQYIWKWPSANVINIYSQIYNRFLHFRHLEQEIASGFALLNLVQRQDGIVIPDN
jgi:hypothetical protein